MEFTDTERKILAMVQGDLPDSATPFADIAAEVGVDEVTVLDLLRRLKASGAIRRFGATLRHQHAGYGANAMVAWQVDEADIERAGEYFASRPEISHCYVRRTYPEWPYNFYTMIHGRSREGCMEAVEEMARETGLTRHEALFSKRELKKTSMRYF